MELTRRGFIGRLGQLFALLSVGWSGATSRKRWVTAMDPVQYWPPVAIPWDHPDATPIEDMRKVIEGIERSHFGTEREQREWAKQFFHSSNW